MAETVATNGFSSPSRIVGITELMEAPEGMIQVGDEFHTVDSSFEDPAIVVGVCERCGKEIRDTANDWSEVTGHVCADGYREYPNGEGIREVDA